MRKMSWQPTGLCWWISSFLLILSICFARVDTEVMLLEPGPQSEMVDSTGWQPLFTMWFNLTQFSLVRSWLAAVIFATIVTWVTGTGAAARSPWLTGLLVVILSVTVDPSLSIVALLTWVAAALSGALLRVEFHRVFLWLFGGLLLTTTAIAVSSDFGFILLLLSGSLAIRTAALLPSRFHRERQPAADRPDQTRHSAAGAPGMPAHQSADRNKERRRLAILFGALVLMVVVLIIGGNRFPAFANALFRPFSNIRFSSLLSSQYAESQTPVILRFFERLVPVAAALLIIDVVLRRRQPEPAVSSVVPACWLALAVATLGLLSPFYSGLSLIAVSTLLAEKREKQKPVRTLVNSPALAAVCCLLFSAAVVFGVTREHGGLLTALMMPERRVAPASWTFSGPVLMTDLTQARDWKERPEFRRLPLLMDDRWDFNGDQLATFNRICTDIRDGRKDPYRGADGTWGGYGAFVSRWNPALIVVNSADVRAIRRLTVDPDWNVAAIDAEWTIFASPTDAGTRRIVKQAADLLYFLEWPQARSRLSFQDIIEAGTPGDFCKVAAVANSLRLPYAALRLVSAISSDEARLVRAWSYTELAHRAIRQAGRLSLIDHLRATHQLFALQPLFRPNSDHGKSIAARLRSLRDEAAVLRAAETENAIGISATEQQIRNLIAVGDCQDLNQRISQLQNPTTADFYCAVASLTEGDTQTCRKLLTAVVESADGRPSLKSEAGFYLGCLALEAGEVDDAANSFVRCLEDSTSTPFKALLLLYLTKLNPN